MQIAEIPNIGGTAPLGYVRSSSNLSRLRAPLVWDWLAISIVFTRYLHGSVLFRWSLLGLLVVRVSISPIRCQGSSDMCFHVQLPNVLPSGKHHFFDLERLQTSLASPTAEGEAGLAARRDNAQSALSSHMVVSLEREWNVRRASHCAEQRLKDHGVFNSHTRPRALPV